MLYRALMDSPIGKISIISDGTSILEIWLENQPSLKNGFNFYQNDDDFEVMDLAKKWLQDYFDGKHPKLEDLPLNPTGPEIHMKIWHVLSKIPYGQAVTFAQLGQLASSEVGHSCSANVIGNAVRRNPLPILIPHHRVVASDGSLLRFPGGTEKKVWLLQHEGWHVENERINLK